MTATNGSATFLYNIVQNMYYTQHMYVCTYTYILIIYTVLKLLWLLKDYKTHFGS